MLESLYYTSTLFKVTFFLYALALAGYVVGIFRKEKVFGTIPYALFTIAFLACTVLIADRCRRNRQSTLR